jgi:hypothetical protein
MEYMSKLEKKGKDDNSEGIHTLEVDDCLC